MHEHPLSTGEKAKARDILAAIRTLKAVEAEGRPPTADEQQALRKFGGFGAVALSIFPDPVSGRFKPGWEDVGRDLRSLLTAAEYDSAKRTTFSQFFTSPVVMSSMHQALSRLGVPGDHEARVCAALDAVGLAAGLRHRRPAELSGGQAQRVAIARALATGARVLLADEPVSGLDPVLRDRVLRTLEHLVADHGLGLLLVSHDLDAVARTCPDLVVLAGGEVVERGPTHQLLHRPSHAVTAALVAARPRLPVRRPA